MASNGKAKRDPNADVLILHQPIRGPSGDMVREVVREPGVSDWQPGVDKVEVVVGGTPSALLTPGAKPRVQTQVVPVPVWKVTIHESLTRAMHYVLPYSAAYARLPIECVDGQWVPASRAVEMREQSARLRGLETVQ